jgi:adhesin transport system outer membrane protein
VFIAGALSIGELARAQDRASLAVPLVIDGSNGPLLRVVTVQNAEPDEKAPIDVAPFETVQKPERAEPPPAKPAPQIPVLREDKANAAKAERGSEALEADKGGKPEAQDDGAKELVGPKQSDPFAKLAKATEVKKVFRETPKDLPPIDELAALRSRQMIEISGSPGIDLASFIQDLPESEGVIQVEVLRADEAVAFALKHNFEVASSRQKKIGARWEEVGAVGQFFPKAEFSRGIGKQRSTPAGFNQNNIRVPDNSHHYKERIWSVTQPIIDLSLISDLLARHNLASSAAAEEQGTRERVALDTVKSYYRLIMYSLTMSFAAEYQKQLDGLTGRMEARVSGGGAAQAELDRIKARSLLVESSIIDAQNNLESTLFEFRRLTGVDARYLTIPSNYLPFVPSNVDDIVRRAVEGNPEFLTSIYRANAAEFDIATFLNRSLPKLQFQISSTRTYNSGGSALDFEATDGGPFAYQNEKKAMMVLSWAFNPTVDIPQTFAGYAKSREEFYKSVDIRKRVEEATRASFSALRTANTRISPMLEAVQASGKVVDAFELQYQDANRSVLDLLDAYERLFQAKRDLVAIMTTEAMAGYQLRRQMGDIVNAVTTMENRDKDGNIHSMNKKN